MWPAVAVLLLIATLLGAGEWWRRNAGGKTDGNVIVSVPVASSASATPAAVEPVAKEPSEAFRIWARNSRISGVRESETGQVRALVNGRLFLDGDLVDAALGLRLVGHSKTERRLIFEDSGGARLEVAY